MSNTRVARKFEELREQGKKGFIAYLSAGDPSLEDTVDIVLRLDQAGVDLIELGLPFSDPMADGRVNQEAATRALEAGSTFDGVMACIKKIREKSEIPIILYAYMNPLVARGFDQALADAAEAGVDGFLLLDLPMEEAKPYHKVFKANRLDSISLVTPTTPEKRIKKIVKQASGFVYCVSREGVTGVQSEINAGAPALVAGIKEHTKLPVALGFGIGTPEQAAEAAAFSDAVVVGSAIVNRFHHNPHTPEGRADAAAFVQSMVDAVKQV